MGVTGEVAEYDCHLTVLMQSGRTWMKCIAPPLSVRGHADKDKANLCLPSSGSCDTVSMKSC